MKKPHFTFRSLWVVSNPGMYTGYGKTRNGAIANSRRQEKRLNELRARLDQVTVELSETRRLLSTYIFKNQDLVARDNDDKADGWVMMACAYWKTVDTKTALAKMRGVGSVVGDREERAAARVQKFLDRWADRLNGARKGIKE